VDRHGAISIRGQTVNLRSYIAASLLFVLWPLALPLSAQEAQESTFGHIKIAGVSVAGLSAAQARQRLTRVLDKKLDQVVVLTDGLKRKPFKRRQLGIKVDVEGMVAAAKQGKKPVALLFAVDPHEMRAALRPLVPAFTAPARNARVVERHGAVKIAAAQSARTIDVEASAHHIAALLKAHDALHLLPLVVEKHPAQVTAATLKGINGRLGHFEKAYNPGNIKRAHNIRVAASVLNGKILKPGEVLSLNETLGERTHEHGYLTANVIADGKLAAGIGGGVSQVAGVLFNAALLCGLPIVEYGAHSHPVLYLPVGRDATLAWNHIDLKFKNNTHVPIYLAYSAAGNKVSATLYGAKISGPKIGLKVVSKKLNDRHITATLYRISKRNGKVVKKEKIGVSDYKWGADYAE
jgi:vancomycin resistance protein YoaR